MTEILLVVSNLLFGSFILLYFYFKEVKNSNRDFEQFNKIINNLQEISKSKDNLTHKALLEYLKHTERLEKMILPQPVTKKAVQEILAQTPPMVPNEIDKTEVELEHDELNELLTKIPITKDTKIAFEGDSNMSTGLEEEIIPNNQDDVMTGKIR